jgi:flagellar protein FliS
MYGAKGTQAYAKIEVESAVMSASQHQLVIMLFDGALSALVRARLFLQDGNIPAKDWRFRKPSTLSRTG